MIMKDKGFTYKHILVKLENFMRPETYGVTVY